MIRSKVSRLTERLRKRYPTNNLGIGLGVGRWVGGTGVLVRMAIVGSEAGQCRGLGEPGSPIGYHRGGQGWPILDVPCQTAFHYCGIQGCVYFVVKIDQYQGNLEPWKYVKYAKKHIFI